MKTLQKVIQSRSWIRIDGDNELVQMLLEIVRIKSFLGKKKSEDSQRCCAAACILVWPDPSGKIWAPTLPLEI